MDESFNIPADTVTINEETRLILLKKINQCEAGGAFLDTWIMDQILTLLENDTVHVFPTYSTVDGTNVPYFAKYVKKEKVGDKVKLILIPLCNGYHFNGYIVNVEKREITFIDSLCPSKSSGRGCTGIGLANLFFPSVNDVLFKSYYKKRVQSDNNSCGAWLVAGMVGFVFNIREHCKVLNRDFVFNLMFIMVEDLELKEKWNKVASVFNKQLCKTKQSIDGKNIPMKLDKCTYKKGDTGDPSQHNSNDNLINPHAVLTPRKSFRKKLLKMKKGLKRKFSGNFSRLEGGEKEKDVSRKDSDGLDNINRKKRRKITDVSIESNDKIEEEKDKCNSKYKYRKKLKVMDNQTESNDDNINGEEECSTKYNKTKLKFFSSDIESSDDCKKVVRCHRKYKRLKNLQIIYSETESNDENEKE